MSEWTERDITDALAVRFGRLHRNGNSVTPRHLFARQVRIGAGFDAGRIIDAIAVDTWMSGGLSIHGFEVKTSRSDWLREIANPTKGQDALTVCSTLSVVAPRGVVSAAEVPAGWGHYELRHPSVVSSASRMVRVVRPPEAIGHSGPIDRGFAVALMRAIAREVAR